jgi:MFS family permease
VSTATGFLALSFCDAVWAAELPAVQVRLGVSTAAVDWILFAANAGVVVMPLAGRCVDRFGGQRVLVAAGAASGLLWIVPGLAGSLWALGAAMLVLGAAKSGFLLVAAEAQASQRERARGRPLMSYYHTVFSIGTVLGALVGSAVTAAGITLPWVLAIVGGGQASMFLAIGAITWRRTVPTAPPEAAGPPAERAERAEQRGGRGFRPLYLLGLCATIGEVAVTGWSALYLRHELHVPPHVAPYGYAAFALAMTVGRLCGSACATRFGSVTVLCASGLLAACGLAATVLLPTPGLVIVAFGVAGAGVACVFPLLLSIAAGRAPEQPGRTMARLVLCTQVGTLASPLLLGWLVAQTTIRAALAGPAVAYLVIALGARTARSATTR